LQGVFRVAESTQFVTRGDPQGASDRFLTQPQRAPILRRVFPLGSEKQREVPQSRLDELTEAFEGPLRAALGPAGLGRLEFLSAPKSVADDTAKLLVRNAEDRPAAVLLVASAVAPDLVARGQQRAREAREALGPELAATVLDALGEGSHQGRSWAVLPYRRPLAEGRLAWRLQRRAISRALLAWLEGAAAATRRAPAGPEVEDGFTRPLRTALSFPDMPGPVREAARRALSRLEDGLWRPHWVLAHNDLWKGNVLCGQGAEGPFVLIDWPASAVRGHAFFDLARCAHSFGVGRARLALAVRRHAALLGCEPADAHLHLAAAVGHLGEILEHMPPDLYRRMGASVFETMTRAVEPGR
jgi:hypothetical protein